MSVSRRNGLYPKPGAFKGCRSFRTGALSSVVTCRSNDYDSSLIRTSALFEISTFLPQQAKEAIDRWHRAAKTLANEAGINVGDLIQRATDIKSVLARNSELGEVCLTPLMLNILQTVYSDQNHDLPSSVSQLCEHAVKRLLIEKHALGELKSLIESHSNWILDAVSEAAFVLHKRVVGGLPKILSEDDLRSVARATCPVIDGSINSYEFRENLITRVASHLRRGHGILQHQRSGEYDFAHNVFREVLAGRALSKLPIMERRQFALDERWHGPIRYWAGIRAASEIGRNEINAFVGELSGGEGSRRIEAVLARAEMLSEVCAVAHGQTLMLDLRNRIATSQTDLLKALRKRQLTFPRRLRIGDLLGVMGDPRLQHPAIERIHWIESGPKRIGRDQVHATRLLKYENVPAAPSIEGTLARFALGQFPVTNAEYRMFIDDGGYRTPKHWSNPEGWAWASAESSTLAELMASAREAAHKHLASEVMAARLVADDFPDQCERMIRRTAPMYWADPAHNRPNQPVVGINWWEAVAYCNWLNDFLHKNNQLAPTSHIRLPTEAEWESAARHCNDSSCFPWKSGTPSDNAHLRATEKIPEARVLRSCAVGLFLFFDPPLPFHDLVGNVWEWTASFAKPYSKDSFSQLIELSGRDDRIARGSSWLSLEAESAEITFRSFDPPYNAYEDLGFRICVVDQTP